jgi:hypothetical protein
MNPAINHKIIGPNATAKMKPLQAANFTIMGHVFPFTSLKSAYGSARWLSRGETLIGASGPRLYLTLRDAKRFVGAIPVKLAGDAGVSRETLALL